MKQRRIHSPSPKPPVARRCGLHVAGPLLCCTLACTPLRDLSSYSSTASSNAGIAGSAPASVVDTGNEPAPLEDGQGGGPAQPDAPDAAAPSTPATNAGASGSSVDAGQPVAVAPCDAADEVSAADGRCSLVVAQAATWDAASAACADWGGALARVDSAEREAELSALTGADMWIGLNDRQTEGSMVWDGGGTLGTFRHWATDQPDDFDGSEDCVELLADGRGYNDRPCTDLRPYVCERE